MKYFTILLTLIFGFEAFGQLQDHYRFQEEGKSMNLVERMEQMKTPGMLIYIDAYDFKDSLALGKLGPVSDELLRLDHLFPAGALSFAPVKIEILRLYQEGRLDLDESIKNYLPQLKDGRLFRFKDITIRDLLLANVRLNGPYKPTGYSANEVRPDLDKVFTEGHQDFPQGIKIKSSKNISGNLECSYAILCQLLLEKIHQQPLNTIIQENIFKPIGMNASFYSSELSKEQETLSAKGTVDGHALDGAYKRYEALAAAGLWTTARDYSLLLRHVLNASKGIDNRILSIENARRGIYKQEGFTTLIFNSQTPGYIYGGGNSKGFYTTFAVDIKEDVIQVLFANADLVWPLLNYASGQTGSYIAKKRDGRLLGIYVPSQLNSKLEKQIALIQSIASQEKIPFEIRKAESGLPKEITALPALVLETEIGNSLYGGLIGEASSLTNFIRTSSYRAIPVKQDKLASSIYIQNGSQQIVIPIKCTGNEDWSERIGDEIVTCMGGVQGDIGLFPTDRKMYLDVYPFYKGDTIFLSYAIFSQFNCIYPISQNFESPLIGNINSIDILINDLVLAFKNEVENYLENDLSGFSLASTSTFKSTESAYTFGPLEKSNIGLDMKSGEPAITGTWTQLTPLSYGQPLVQFNFPAPLNRYAGELKQVVGNIEMDGGMISGFFETELSSLTMGMADLDAKVLKQYIRVKSNPNASFSFENIPMACSWDVDSLQKIQGIFSFMGKMIPLEVEAQIRPEGRDQSLNVAVNFVLEITETFGITGPDGPQEASNNLEFSVNVKMKA